MLGLQIPRLSLCECRGTELKPSFLPCPQPELYIQDSLISLEMLPCVFSKHPQRGLGAGRLTTADRHVLPLWRVWPLTPFPGSHESTQPLQEIQPQATGYTLKLTLGPPPSSSHSQLLLPWMEDSQRNVPPTNLSLADGLSSHHVTGPIPFVLFSLSHKTHFFPWNPPYCRPTSSP